MSQTVQPTISRRSFTRFGLSALGLVAISSFRRFAHADPTRALSCLIDAAPTVDGVEIALSLLNTETEAVDVLHLIQQQVAAVPDVSLEVAGRRWQLDPNLPPPARMPRVLRRTWLLVPPQTQVFYATVPYTWPAAVLAEPEAFEGRAALVTAVHRPTVRSAERSREVSFASNPVELRIPRLA